MTMRIELPGDTLRSSRRVRPLRVTLEQLARASHNDESSTALLNLHPGKVRLGRFRNFNGADIGKDIG